MTTKCGDTTVVEQVDTPAVLVPTDWPMANTLGQLANQLDNQPKN
jgi:hypothetical protein